MRGAFERAHGMQKTPNQGTLFTLCGDVRQWYPVRGCLSRRGSTLLYSYPTPTLTLP